MTSDGLMRWPALGVAVTHISQPVTFRIHLMELTDEILTIQELAERLKVKKSTIYDPTRRRAIVRAENRPLPCIKVGKQLRFNWRLVCKWLTELEEAREKQYSARRSR